MRVKGLDTIRFILAMMVVIGHIGFDFTKLTDLPILKIGFGIVNNMFCGTAAVIVFFIISGFCIHFPYSTGKQMNALEFTCKRFIRISIPAIIGMLLFYALTSSLLDVVWSLVCELIYYICYPYILRFNNSKNNVFKSHIIIFSILTFLSLVTSVCYDIFHTSYHGGFARTGFLFTWIVGFPVWYLGVILADLFVKGKQVSFISMKYINLYRIGIFCLSIACSIARFHLNISYSYSLILFSVPAFFWLYAELLFFKNRNENALLEFGGIMSYSIYIIHESVFKMLILMSIVFFGEIVLKETVVYIFIIVAATILGSFVFYKLVEKPSHKLAQKIKLN